MRRIIITPVTAASPALESLAAALAAQKAHFDDWWLWTDAASGPVDVPWAVVSRPATAYRGPDGRLRVEPCFQACVDADTAYLVVRDTVAWISPTFVKAMFEFREATRFQHAVVTATGPGDLLDAWSFVGSEFVPFGGRVPLDADDFLGVVWPERVGRPNAACPAAKYAFEVPAASQPQPWPLNPGAKPAEATPQATPEATPEAAPEATPEAAPEAAPEATPEATTPVQPPAPAEPAAPTKKRLTRRRIAAS